MKIVYFGTDVFLPCFEYLAGQHDILALYTYHNDEDYFTEYSIVRRAQALGIPVHYEPVSPQRIEQYFTGEGCGLFFIAEYNRILTLPKGLDCFRGINTHSSLLPLGRSYYPIECAMERGLAQTGVTMHKLTPRLDSGDILAQRTIQVTPEMDSIDIYLQCAANAREMLARIMDDLDGAWADGAPQARRLPYWPRPDSGLLTLDHGLTTAQAARIFRRYNSMTQVRLNGAWYYVTALMAGPAPLDTDVRALAADRWLYRTADGHLRLSVRPMPAEGSDL